MNDAKPSSDAGARAARLTCWSGQVTPVPIEGGITNRNFRVEDAGCRYFVRIGDDIPVHGVMRFNELAATRAAAAIGLSPPLIHSESGAIVTAFIDGRTWTAEDARDPANGGRAVELVRLCHREMPAQVRGPVLMFWVFHVLRDYAQTLRRDNSRHTGRLDRLLRQAARLEAAVGPIEVVFGHNDLLAANFIDDGERLWLVDWDYAGFNSPLFDLANFASNNELTEDQERALLERYFARPFDAALWRRYSAMKCASLLRETMWSMVSESRSTLDFDYAAYTDENLARFNRAYDGFEGV